MFLTDAQTLQAISDTLQSVSVDNLPAFWTNINTQCHLWAYNELFSALIARGFTQTQIAGWDRGADFELDLTVYRALERGSSLHEFDDKFISKFDRREDLKTVLLTVNGQWQTPGDIPGTVTTGPMNQSGGVFNFDPSKRCDHDYGIRW